ncbi:hypothetical protein KG088_10495 [Halomonas sp. TRM85114]|nr:hypothetical protein [Halomonas jincaotanensis]MBS9404059.1 hypothetical protein [Halomonas jincaotanensis]
MGFPGGCARRRGLTPEAALGWVHLLGQTPLGAKAMVMHVAGKVLAAGV